MKLDDLFGPSTPKGAADGLQPIRRVVGAGTTNYGRAALADECARVRATPPGSRNENLNRAAFRMGGLIGANELDLDEARGELWQAARDAGDDERKIASALRLSSTGGLIVGQDDPRAIAELDDVFPRGRILSIVGFDEADALTDDEEFGVPSDAHDEPTAPHALDEAEEAREAAGGPDEPQDGPEVDEAARAAQERRDALVRAEAANQWVKREARKQLDDMEHEAGFRTPPSLFTLADELALPDDDVSFAIDKLVPTGGNVLLTAAFKAGKTTLVNNLARAFADRERFLDRFDVHAPEGRIALFNHEVGPGQYRRWLRESGIEHPERVAVWNLRGYSVPFTVPRVADLVVRWLVERECVWWVIDPFAAAYKGTSENDNAEVSRWLDAVDAIKERAGVDALWLPAHTGRAQAETGQERARGATRLDDWADVRWILTRDEESGARFLRATGRDVDVPEEALTFDAATRRLTFGGGDRAWMKRRAHEDLVAEAVAEQPGMTSVELYAAIREKGVTGNPSKLKGLVDAAVRGRRVSREETTRNGGRTVLHYPIKSLGMADRSFTDNGPVAVVGEGVQVVEDVLPGLQNAPEEGTS